MKKLFLFLFLSYLISVENNIFLQIPPLFEYRAEGESAVEKDLFNGAYKKVLTSKKTIIYGLIFQKSLNPPDEHRKEIEEWLNPYNTYKFSVYFDVINIESSDYSVSFKSKDHPKKYDLKKSTVFIITKDTLLIKELNSNGTNYGISIEDTLRNKNDKNDSIILFRWKDTGNSRGDFSDFQWKTNQIIYNLEHIPEANKKEKPTKKTNFFQISYQSSLINSKNTQFDRASNNQIDLIMNKKMDSIQILVVGGGISLAQNRFSSSSNLRYSEVGSSPLDSIYASLSGVSENHSYQSINLVGFLAVKIKKFEFSLSPFYALQSNLSSTVTGGSITTYGFKNQISDYLYDIPELGLKTQTEEILNAQNYFKTRSYGFNAGISYNINLGTLIVAPNLNLKFISIHNKNSISNAYSIPEDKYNGLFATLKNTKFLFPTLGLSISF